MQKKQCAVLSFAYLAVILTAVYCNYYLGIANVYTHLFYVLILLTAILAQKYLLPAGFFLGALHIFLEYLNTGSFSLAAICRVLILLLVVAIVLKLRGQLNDQRGELIELKNRLQLSEKRNSAILNAIPDMIFVFSADGQILDYQASSMEELFLPPELFLHKNIAEILPGELGETTLDSIRKALHTGEIQFFEYSMDQRGMHYFEARLVPFQDHNCLGIVRNISENYRAEAALRESEDLHRTIFQTTGAASILIGEDFTIIMANIEFARLSGYSIDELAGKKSWQEFVAADDLVKMRQYHDDRRDPQKISVDSYEFKFINRAGEIRYCINNVAIIPGTAKSIASVVDITERKQAEEELRAAYEQMEATMQELIAIQDELEEQTKQLLAQEQVLRGSRQNLADIINFLPDATLVVDNQGKVVFWNKAMEEISGVPAAQMLGRGNYEYALPFYGVRRPTLIDLAVRHDGEMDKFINTYDFIRQEGDTFLAEVFLPHTKGGQGIHVWAAASRLYDLQGNIVGAIEAIRDISDRKKAELALAESEEKFRLIAENTGDSITVMDMNLNIIYASPAVQNIRGYTVEEVLQQRLDQILAPESRKKMVELFKEQLILEQNGSADPFRVHRAEVEEYHKDGSTIMVEASVSFLRDKDLKATGVIVVSRDITDRKMAEEQIKYLSFHDSLTDVYNRRFFEESLKRLDTPRNLPLTLIMADINGLKLTNDAFGHLTGDKLLQKAAEILKRECRTDDIISRTGGDEFVIMLPQTDYLEAETLVRRLYNAINHEWIDTIQLSVSLGWASKIDPEESIEDIYKRAEDKMYQRKLYESPSMRGNTIKTIIHTMYETLAGEKEHSEQVSHISELISNELKTGLDVAELKMAGLMHDIGKITLNESTLNKSGLLDPAEWIEVKRHPETGYRILSSVNELAQLAEYTLAHHENWDGSGYPKGLKGEEIPLQSRILRIADSYDAMSSWRSYRDALSREEIIAEFKKNAGIQFDPNLTALFLDKVLPELEAEAGA